MIILHGNAKFLALCEGNKCGSGSTGRDPGGGTILVYYLSNSSNTASWIYNDKIKLPEDLSFIDYSGVDVRRGKGWGVVTSQQQLVRQPWHRSCERWRVGYCSCVTRELRPFLGISCWRGRCIETQRRGLEDYCDDRCVQFPLGVL